MIQGAELYFLTLETCNGQGNNIIKSLAELQINENVHHCYLLLLLLLISEVLKATKKTQASSDHSITYREGSINQIIL